MVQQKAVDMANEYFAKIEAAAQIAMFEKHYSAAATLVTALGRMQRRYGGGAPMVQIGREVLDDAYGKMCELIQEPFNNENWDTVAYVSEFLSILSEIFEDECQY